MASPNFTYTPTDLAANGDALEAQIRRELGLGDNPADWEYKDRVEYNNLLASRLATRPDLYGEAAVIAAKYKPQSGDLEEYGFFEAVGDFGSEFVKQGQQINPFSEENRSKSSNTLIIVAVAAIVLGLAWIGFRVKGS